MCIDYLMVELVYMHLVRTYIQSSYSSFKLGISECNALLSPLPNQIEL
jgi:hypothetical protein